MNTLTFSLFFIFSSINSSISQNTSNNNNKSELKFMSDEISQPTAFEYMGLFFFESKDIIYKTLENSFSKFPHFQDRNKLSSDFNKGKLTLPWHSPDSDDNEYHSTTLYKGPRPVEEVQNDLPYIEFVEGAPARITALGVGYISEGIIFLIVNTDKYSNNSYKHVTIALNTLQAKHSNDVLISLFDKGGDLGGLRDIIFDGKPTPFTAELSVNVEGKAYTCYVDKFINPIVINAKMHAK